MASKIGDLYWAVNADTTKFNKGLKTTETQAKGLGTSFTSLGKLIQGGFAVAAVAGIASVSMELIDAASAAQETQNKFEVVFEDVAYAAEQAGEAIKDEFKISDQDTKAFLSQVGDITSGLGATGEEALAAADKITRLGLDIDSFANLSGGAEQAVSALTSLFTGEREAAKALGIVINETNLKQYAEDTGLVYSEMTQLEKGFLSLELAEQQSQKALGDFARSSDSYANKVRAAEGATEDLKVAIGENLLGAATGTAVALGGLTRALADYIETANAAKAVRRDLLDGTLEEETSLEDLQAEYALLSAKIALANGQATKAQRQEQLALEALIGSYGIKDSFLEKEHGLKEALSREDIARADREQALYELQLTAAARLAELDAAKLTDTDRQLQALQEEIDYWAQLREVQGAQDIINQLIAERNELLAAGNVTLEETAGYMGELGTTSSMYYDNAVSRSEELAEVQDAEAGRIQELEDRYKSLASSGIGVVTDSISAMTEALVLQEDGWDAFAKAGLLSIAAILDGFAAELTAMAAVATAASIMGKVTDLPAIPVSLGGAVAASAASGLLRGLAGSFEQGGIIPEIPGVPATGDNMLARVNPGEQIVPADESSQPTEFVFMFDGDVFARGVVDRINSGQNLINLNRGTYSE